MEGALSRLRYYQGLLSTGLISDETSYVSLTQNAVSTRGAVAALEAIDQIMNFIPDI